MVIAKHLDAVTESGRVGRPSPPWRRRAPAEGLTQLSCCGEELAPTSNTETPSGSAGSRVLVFCTSARNVRAKGVLAGRGQVGHLAEGSYCRAPDLGLGISPTPLARAG